MSVLGVAFYLYEEKRKADHQAEVRQIFRDAQREMDEIDRRFR